MNHSIEQLQDNIYHVMLTMHPEVAYDATTDVDKKKIDVCCNSPEIKNVANAVKLAVPVDFEIKVDYDTNQEHDDMRRWV